MVVLTVLSDAAGGTMASPQLCPRCRQAVLVSISDRIATTRCDIAIVDRGQAIAAVVAGRTIFHFRDNKLRKGPSLAYPMLIEHRCLSPRNADEARTLAKTSAPSCHVPPF